MRSCTGNVRLRRTRLCGLARYFGMSERFWMNLQIRYDLEVEKARLKGRLVNEVAVRKAS